MGHCDDVLAAEFAAKLDLDVRRMEQTLMETQVS